MIRLLGRTSVDVLKSGGYKISALEIEAALREHPAIADLAVIGVPDPTLTWGDLVTACVVLRDGATLTLDELKAFARDRLAVYKIPRALRVCAALPRNAMGKVQKRQLLDAPGTSAAMIRLVYSNATEELLAALAAAIAEERRAAGPLEPVRVVVPNANIETYVKLGLARARRRSRPTSRSRSCAGSWRASPSARCRRRAPSTPITSRAACWRCFTTRRAWPIPSSRPCAPISRRGRRPDAVDRRRCQLAATLARLFDEYASSRAAHAGRVARAWDARARAIAPGRGAPAAHDERARFAATERWQRALWLAIFGRGGRLVEERGRAPERRSCRSASCSSRPSAACNRRASGATLHVFGVSYVAESYHRMLALLGRHIDVRIYTLNPCREFWEDLDTAREAARRTKRETAPVSHAPRGAAAGAGAVDDDPFALAGDGEMLALRLWGRPGRENIRLLNQLTDADFDGALPPPRGRGRRAAGRCCIACRTTSSTASRATRPDPALSADGSITVLPCPGLRRELEVIAAEIWRMVRADPSLRFNQIAVIVPEASKEAYLLADRRRLRREPRSALERRRPAARPRPRRRRDHRRGRAADRAAARRRSAGASCCRC